MIKPWVIVAIGCLLCLPIISNAADAKAVTLGFSIGHYDIDTENSSDPHVNGRTYSLLLGYEWSKYFAVELEWSPMQRQTDADVFDCELAFEAAAMGLSGRLQWPLDEHFKAYARLGMLSLSCRMRVFLTSLQILRYCSRCLAQVCAATFGLPNMCITASLKS